MIARFFFCTLIVFPFAMPYSQAQVIQTGYQSVIHNFETVTKSLSLEIEENYDLFIIINSAEGPTPINAFLPNQHLLIIGKGSGASHVFNRDKNNVITGISQNSLTLSDLLSSRLFSKAKASSPISGLPFEWNGLEILPVSTGTQYHFPTFSGIFQLNWPRSQNMRSRDYNDPMSNALYVGYFYHDDAIEPQDFKKNNRDRVSYLAIHGTPRENWKLLGRTRASHGCARILPHFNEGIYQVIESLPSQKVINLDWNYELPHVDKTEPTRWAKPVLIIIFNGYKSLST